MDEFDDWAIVDATAEGKTELGEPPIMLDCHYSIEDPPPLPPYPPMAQRIERKTPLARPAAVRPRVPDLNRPLPSLPVTVVPVSIGLGVLLARAIKGALVPKTRQARRLEERRAKKLMARGHSIVRIK